ncbi:UbiX family flavin prenyltransferase [bacterium]|nr:UbiX family flavin prenyltransferase [bacterium]
MRRLVVGISGASGAIYGIRLMQFLRERPEFEVHLVMTRSGGVSLRLENPDWELSRVRELAHKVHREDDISASIASGSFAVEAMVVAPCSMRSLGAIAHGLSDNLLTRAADVMLKERRKLILLTREMPLHAVHIKNMLAVTEMGGIIMPPMPGFYHQPASVMDLVDFVVGKVLDTLAIPHSLVPPWTGPPGA